MAIKKIRSLCWTHLCLHFEVPVDLA